VAPLSTARGHLSIKCRAAVMPGVRSKDEYRVLSELPFRQRV